MVSLRDVNWLSRRLRLLMSSEAAVLASDMSSLAARVTALEMIALSLDARLDTIEANYLKRIALPDLADHDFSRWNCAIAWRSHLQSDDIVRARRAARR